MVRFNNYLHTCWRLTLCYITENTDTEDLVFPRNAPCFLPLYQTTVLKSGVCGSRWEIFIEVGPCPRKKTQQHLNYFNYLIDMVQRRGERSRYLECHVAWAGESQTEDLDVNVLRRVHTWDFPQSTSVSSDSDRTGLGWGSSSPGKGFCGRSRF